MVKSQDKTGQQKEESDSGRSNPESAINPRPGHRRAIVEADYGQGGDKPEAVEARIVAEKFVFRRGWVRQRKWKIIAAVVLCRHVELLFLSERFRAQIFAGAKNGISIDI
jgi:hypothetical protein